MSRRKRGEEEAGEEGRGGAGRETQRQGPWLLAQLLPELQGSEEQGRCKAWSPRGSPAGPGGLGRERFPGREPIGRDNMAAMTQAHPDALQCGSGQAAPRRALRETKSKKNSPGI